MSRARLNVAVIHALLGTGQIWTVRYDSEPVGGLQALIEQ